jgi:SAM-dependent methyltransferase
MLKCLFCECEDLLLKYTGLYHPFANTHGPFDFYHCRGCGSGLTLPIPSPETIAGLYATFKGGMIPGIRDLRDRYPLRPWFRQCINRATGLAGLQDSDSSRFHWIDLGAGSGELAIELEKRYPAAEGLAVDFHQRPAALAAWPRVNWKSADLNATNFIESSAMYSARYVFSITVLEHLLRPDSFVASALRLLDKGGCFYLTTPRLDCLAYRLMGRNWPYFLPGEHLHIPSVKGMRILLERICRTIYPAGECIVYARPVIMPYPAGYYLSWMGLGAIARLLPDTLTWGFPTGMLEAAVVRSAPWISN